METHGIRSVYILELGVTGNNVKVLKVGEKCFYVESPATIKRVWVFI